jgi:hypothetical protein
VAKRSIEDAEIAMIKSMLNRGMKNKDIQFYFNRRDRPVNSGRISSIKNGSYSNSSKIPASSEAEAEQFISRFAFGIKRPGSDRDEEVRQLFSKGADSYWYLQRGESEELECKLHLDTKKLTAVVRAIAALANNRGGYIFFGLSDKQYRVEGANAAFAETEIVQIMDKVKAHLAPTPSVTAKGVLDFDGKTVGFLKVERHSDRPVLVYRDGEGLNEGDILYRYAGQSSRIKFGDLRAMLDERDRRAQVSLAKAAGMLADVGTANALILDTDKNTLDANGRSILIDQRLVDSIKFIKEGQFDERAGAPRLRLIGEVTAVNVNASAAKAISREAIFQEDILNAFLKLERVEHPYQYIIAGLAQSRQWLPIFYFARISGQSNSQIADAIMAQKISQEGKKNVLLQRLTGHKTTLTKAATKSAQSIGAAISSGTLPVPKSSVEVSSFAHGVTTVRTTKIPLEELLEALLISRNLVEKADDKKRT